MRSMPPSPTAYQSENYIFDVIVDMVEPGSRVLDLGCGNGALLSRLIRERGVKGMGVDIEEAMVLQCIQKGISVFQGDLDEGLKDYETGSYDYVILSHTLQVVHRPKQLLQEMIRVGRRVIVNFPNFGYLGVRLKLLFTGRMPETRDLPYKWYDTPNIHLCTRADFLDLCRELGIPILKEITFRRGRILKGPLRNVRSTEACYLLKGLTG
ncbi:methionine biosynthesis protein MetW [Spirochaeta thermophila]|uniref:Methionine biosynthesis protein MetW n=1 Tax=Winmispira thermophila (strain ATCC 49972 / DSM 6192 / RI 19.B1) TaxID=665571 RepID=E0RRU6_WINT6|nr:methionine biosynthesis protein MetW [Spirochaeta thermophila]ADN01733.1 hypothetical protein STHERM_c07820 [Spirochaeta thermophila DSM 6192]